MCLCIQPPGSSLQMKINESDTLHVESTSLSQVFIKAMWSVLKQKKKLNMKIQHFVFRVFIIYYFL